MIGILDYGMGNLKSVANSLEFLSIKHSIIRSQLDFKSISHLIIPGVGTFPKAMKNIHSHGYFNPVQDFALSGKPILGICLGMQLLADEGTEVETCRGLGLIKGKVIKMTPHNLRIPHIGWNSLKIVQDIKLFEGVKKSADVYFVHSYHFIPSNQDNISIIMTATEFYTR